MADGKNDDRLSVSVGSVGGGSKYDGASCHESEDDSSDSSSDIFRFRGVGARSYEQDANVGGPDASLSTLDLAVGKFRTPFDRLYSLSSSENDDDDDVIWTSLPHDVATTSCIATRDREAEIATHESEAEIASRSIATRDAILANDRVVRVLDAMERHLEAELERVRKTSEPGTIKGTIDESLGRSPASLDEKTFPECDVIYRDVVYHAGDDRPPPNQECVDKKARGHLDFTSLPKVFFKWTNSDKAKLRRVVDLVRSKQRREIMNADRSPKGEVFLDEKDYDWDTIAQWFEGRHSAPECRAMWLNHVLPTARGRVHATARERKRLREVAVRHDEQDWDAIAGELGTGRSALQCFAMYQSEQSHAANRPWSPEEEEQLKRLVEENRSGDVIDWYSISFEMPGRDLKRVYEHWRGSANPEIHKGKFTDAENLRMVTGIRMYGLNFSKIAKELMPWRTGVQIRDHHSRMLPISHAGRWTREEDMAILHLVEAYGTRWRAVSEHFVSPCRTRSQIRSRYVTLQRWMASTGVAKRQTTRQVVAWIKRRERLRSLTEYANSKVRRLGRRVGRQAIDRQRHRVDEVMDTFVTRNFVDGRNGRRRPGSLREAFVLDDAEVEVRATETRKMLGILGARLNMSEGAVTRSFSISNRDKAVFLRLLDPVEDGNDGDGAADQLEPREEASTQPGTSSAPLDESMDIDDAISTAQSSTHEDAPHSDFLLPHVASLDGLLKMLTDPFIDAEKVKPVGTRKTKRKTHVESTKEAENLKKAEDLWMERLKTIYMYSMLVPAEDQLDAGESSGGEEEEEISESCEVAVVETKRRVGRPRKKRRGTKKVSEEEAPPKREYKKTGKYSKMKDFGARRSSQRNRSTVAGASDLEPTKEV